MPRPRSRSSRSRGGRRTQNSWFNIGFSADVAAVGISAANLLPQGTMPIGWASGFTIRRLLFDLALSGQAGSTQVQAALGFWVGPWTSITSDPALPGTELMNWYLHANVDSLTTADSGPRNYKWDIRTVRRISGEDRTLGFVIEGAAAGAAFHYEAAVRLLLTR